MLWCGYVVCAPPPPPAGLAGAVKPGGMVRSGSMDPVNQRRGGAGAPKATAAEAAARDELAADSFTRNATALNDSIRGTSAALKRLLSAPNCCDVEECCNQVCGGLVWLVCSGWGVGEGLWSLVCYCLILIQQHLQLGWAWACGRLVVMRAAPGH